MTKKMAFEISIAAFSVLLVACGGSSDSGRSNDISRSNNDIPNFSSTPTKFQGAWYAEDTSNGTNSVFIMYGNSISFDSMGGRESYKGTFSLNEDGLFEIDIYESSSNPPIVGMTSLCSYLYETDATQFTLACNPAGNELYPNIEAPTVNVTRIFTLDSSGPDSALDLGDFAGSPYKSCVELSDGKSMSITRWLSVRLNEESRVIRRLGSGSCVGLLESTERETWSYALGRPVVAVSSASGSRRYLAQYINYTQLTKNDQELSLPVKYFDIVHAVHSSQRFFRELYFGEITSEYDGGSEQKRPIKLDFEKKYQTI